MLLRVTSLVLELASTPAYHASTIVRSRPNAQIATTRPTSVRPVRSLCLNAFFASSLSRNTASLLRPRARGPPRASSRARVVDEHALLQVHDAARVRGGLRVVRHHDDCLAHARHELPEQPQHLLA